MSGVGSARDKVPVSAVQRLVVDVTYFLPVRMVRGFLCPSDLVLADVYCFLLAQAASARYSRLSSDYLLLRKEIARLKAAASKLKRNMRKLEAEAEDRLERDDLMAAEEEAVSCARGRESIVAPSGLEFDLSEAPFSELGGGPGMFWAGDFVDDNPVEPVGS
jgi:cell division protein FtsB